ncbi:MAG: hypothetical protein EBQ83_04280 [Burkholderiaceae bacterium]|nr:hypothetical protein [Burkholderiaceae bacterium]
MPTIKISRNQIKKAKAFGKLEQAAGLFAITAHYDKRKKLIVLDLANGSSFSFPPIWLRV